MSAPTALSTAPMTYREAIRLALREELSADPDVILLGEEIGVFEGSYKVTAVAETRLTERLVERALETGARVTPVEGAAAGALAEAAGIAALLRW